MIFELIQRDSFGKCLQQVQNAIVAGKEAFKKNEPNTIRSAETHQVELSDFEHASETMRELLQKGLPAENGKDAAWLPRDRAAAVLQAALDEFYTQADAVLKTDAKGLADDEIAITDLSLKPEWLPADPHGFTRSFESLDARWVLRFSIAKALKKLRGIHAFPNTPPPTAALGARARVILVGDWGSGTKRAQKVGNRMRDALFAPEAKQRDLHVIHLGDVYYAGFESEYRTRFLPYWPVKEHEASRIGSWCLNANHDMFGGGSGYFDFLLADPRFARQQRTSYFALENDDWQILCLDTGYDSRDVRGEAGTLHGPQAAWVAQKRAAAPRKQKAVLLSHHQLFSPWAGDSPDLATRLKPVLSQPNGITAWFWGHEHRCAIYDETHLVRHARLIGHGGVPAYAPASGDALPAGVKYEFRESFRQGMETFTRFGFATLDFDHDGLAVTYVDENGKSHYSEIIK
jgi:hypothetical protein